MEELLKQTLKKDNDLDLYNLAVVTKLTGTFCALLLKVIDWKLLGGWVTPGPHNIHFLERKPTNKQHPPSPPTKTS